MTQMSPPTDMRRPSRGTFVQTDRSSHRAWATLTVRKPSASAILHLLAAHVGNQNAVVVSQGTIAKAIGVNERTVNRAINDLSKEGWLQIVRIGAGKEAAYVLNDRAVWAAKRDSLNLSLFSANIIANADEQMPGEVENYTPLLRIPAVPDLEPNSAEWTRELDAPGEY